MIPKSGNRFSEKIMLSQGLKTMVRFNLNGSWSCGSMLTFASLFGSRICECENQWTTSKYKFVVELWF